MKRGLILLLAWSFVTGCSDGECVPFEGTTYNWDKVSELSVGDTADEIREQIGSPVSVSRVSPHLETWRFFYRCKRTSWVAVGGMKVRSGGITMHSEAILRPRDGRLEAIVKNDGWAYE